MVEGAQSQSIRNVVRAAVGMPSDVRRFEPEQIVIEAQVETADCTATLVRDQYQLAKARITIGSLARLSFLFRNAVQRHRFQDVLVHRHGKMFIEYLLCGGASARMIGAQQPV